MIVINEWLPNPTGADATGEWVELFNTGDQAISVIGWQLKTKGGGKTVLTGELGAHEYAVLKRADTKLTLRNTDEGLFLYDAQGKLEDQSSFLGSAPEGESYSRHGDIFSFLMPTPGKPNEVGSGMVLSNQPYPIGQPLNHKLGAGEFLALLLGVSVVITGLIFFVVHTNENLQDLFFGRN